MSRSAARTTIPLALALALLVSPSAVLAKKNNAPKETSPADLPAPGSVLTPRELTMNCRGLAGRMQIRILELRGSGAKSKGTAAAEGIQGGVVPLFGGTKRGIDATGEANLDIVRLRAMNDRLIGMDCPRYDLDAELAKGPGDPTPHTFKPKAGETKAKGNSPAKSKP